MVLASVVVDGVVVVNCDNKSLTMGWLWSLSWSGEKVWVVWSNCGGVVIWPKNDAKNSRKNGCGVDCCVKNDG